MKHNPDKTAIEGDVSHPAQRIKVSTYCYRLLNQPKRDRDYIAILVEMADNLLKGVVHFDESAEQLPPQAWSVLRDLASVLEKKGHLSEAIDASIASLELNPIQPKLYERAMRWSLLLGRPDEGKVIGELGCRAVPDSLPVQALFCSCAGEEMRLQAGFKEARDYMHDAVLMYPGLGYASGRLMMIESQAKDIQPRRLKAGHTSGSYVFAISQLGHNGRFGHSLQEYLLGKWLAKKNGVDLAIPEWFGDYLYEDKNEPLLKDVYRDCPSDYWENDLSLEVGNEPWNMSDECRKNMAADPGIMANLRRFRKEGNCLTRYRPVWRSEIKPILEKVFRSDRQVIAVHVRRTDMEALAPQYAYPVEKYAAWVESLCAGLQNPCVYVATDGGDAVKAAFAKFNPIELDLDPESTSDVTAQLVDFEILRRASYLAVARSRFSTLAMLLNENLIRVGVPSTRGMATIEAGDLERATTYAEHRECLLF